MHGIVKIAKSLHDLGKIIRGESIRIENEAKEQKTEFLMVFSY